jgi:hypothetical protein
VFFSDLGRISAKRADEEKEEVVETEVEEEGTTNALAEPAARRIRAAESFMVD